MKYTIVYADSWHSGSHAHSITKFDRVETNNIAKLIAKEQYSFAVWFVFEGWPKLEGEDSAPTKTERGRNVRQRSRTKTQQ